MTEAQQQRLQLLAARFDEWLQALNFSPKTRVNYGRDVRLFLAWLAANTMITAIAEATPQHLQQYQLWLYNYERQQENKPPRRLSVGAQAARLAAVRKFFAWLVREQQIAYDPAATLQMPRQPRRLPRHILTKEEAERLLEATPTDKPRDIRDRAILETLYGTGLRRAELIALTIYNLNLEAATLQIERGKGQQSRLMPLPAHTLAALKLYLSESRPLLTKESSQAHLFVSSRSGGPLDPADIVRIVQKAAKRAGIKKHITPHALRHSLATHLLQGQADIRQIQKLLGHQHLSSTEVYTHVEIGDLRAVIDRCHPRGKMKAEE